MKHDIYGENQDLRIKVLRLESENKKLQLENKELNEKFSLYGVSHRRELLPKRLSNRAYRKAKTLRYEEFVKWWDEQV